MSRWTRIAGVVVLCVGMLAASVAAGEAKAAAKPTMDELVKQLAAYEYGQSRQPVIDMAERVRNSYQDAAARQAIAGRLIALVESKDATPACKWFCCEQISIIGADSAVPVLARLLPDPQMSHRARIGLERIPGPKAAAALQAFLAQAKGKLLIGAINSLGERRDTSAVAAVARFLGNADEAVAGAAAIALGKIGGPQATAALRQATAKASAKLRPVVAGAYLRCGDHLVAAGQNAEAWGIYQPMYAEAEPKTIRIAALRGLVNADRAKALPLITAALTGDDPELRAVATQFVRETKDPAETTAYVALLPKMEPGSQVLLIAALADRGDPTARPAVVAAAKGQEPTVRLAAVCALATLGDASTVMLLGQVAATGAGSDRKAATDSLNRLSGAGVNDAIVKGLAGADPNVQRALMRALADRRYAPAVPTLLALAKSKDGAGRPEAIRAAGILADGESYPALIDLLVTAPGGGEQVAAEEAIRSLCSRIRDEAKRVEPLLAAMPKANLSARCAILRVLGKVGGGKALGAVRAALKDKEVTIYETALRSLAGWPDPSAAADLMNLVKAAEKPAQRIIAFRGYCRMAGLRATQSPTEGLKMYQGAMKAAPRLEEKKLVLGGIGNIRHVAALGVALEYVGDQALKAEAAAAVRKIANDRDIKRRHRKEADAALKEVQEATKKK